MILQKIKHLITQYFKVWWIPILSYFVPFVIVLTGNAIKSDSVIDFSLILFFINFLGNIISSIVQIVTRKWYYIFPQIGISILLYFIVSFIFTFSPPDYYGANKTIPSNIEIFEPAEKEPTKIELEQYDLILSSGGQPGIYNFFTAKKPPELGYFYIKAFEVTSNDKLSEERVKSRSQIEINDLDEKIYSGEFTIYEGSWGDKYGARIELWFETLDRKKNYKIAQRNYIIEGWTR